MNQDEIIRMAREAFIARGFWPNEVMWDCWKDAWLTGAAAEREKVAQWMLDHSYATGHGDTTEDLLKELDWQIRESEREACAAICDRFQAREMQPAECAAAIRARGSKT